MSLFERPPPVDYKFRSQHHLVGKFFVEAYDAEGKQVGHAESAENDLLLNNFGFFLSNILPAGISTGTLTFSTMIARGGVGITVTTYSSGPTTASKLYFGLLSQATSIGAYVGVGTSSTAPARTDTDLNGLLSITAATSSGYGTASNQVIIAGAPIISSAATVAEAGVYANLVGTAGVGGNITMILFAHDLVTPNLAIPSGGVASVNWALQI